MRLPRMSRFACERFRDSYLAEHERCWVWLKEIDSEGCGLFLLSHEKYQAHRVMYLLEYGWFNPAYTVMQSCGVKSCVNPRHLYLLETSII